ncbi:hypothetical protein V8E51_013670 [Hyaloscypha variabilis]
MVVEYSSVHHGGLELIPSDQYPIAIAPGASVRVASTLHDAPELARPSNRSEHAPEPFMPVTSPDYPVNNDDALPEKHDDKTAEATVTEDPAKKKNGLFSKKVLLIGIIVLLVVVIVGLGVGLGVSLGRKHTGFSSPNTATQISSLAASTQINPTLSPTPTSAPTSIGSVISAFIPSSTNVTTSTGQDILLNDQLSTTHISSWFYTGQTEGQVNELCTLNNARITQVRVDNATVPTFTVLMIENTGVYYSDWWWWYGPNSYDQGTDRRLISIDPYYDSSGTLQFAVVQVPNNGTQDRAWWWYYGQSTSSITTLQAQYNARLTSLRGYEYNGDVVYVILMVENVDQDLIQSEWETSITIDTINSKIASGLRLLSLAPDPSDNSRWDAIFVAETGNPWGWYYGLDYSSIGATTTQNKMRMVDISPYMLDGQPVFATVETDNSQ